MVSCRDGAAHIAQHQTPTISDTPELWESSCAYNARLILAHIGEELVVGSMAGNVAFQFGFGIAYGTCMP